MKNLRYLHIALIAVAMLSASSCDHDEILTETPKDFLSPENSYTNISGFLAGLAQIHVDIRDNFYANRDDWKNFDMLGLDADLGVLTSGVDTWETYIKWEVMNGDQDFVGKWWERLYKIIFNANVIIGRAEEDIVKWDSEEQKNAIVGEARFLRAFAYRILGNMWGGVPLVLTETSEAKFDYERATQEEVYLQCKEDLVFATKWMNTVDQIKGGQAPRAAAYHLLAEVNIQLEDYQGAIDAASTVINDGNFALMTERFGTFKDFQFNGYDYQGPMSSWGDVYWDLFREGNFNWQQGNSEAIWNVQFDFTIDGGGNYDQFGGGFVLERRWGVDWWRAKDINGVSQFLKDTLSGRPNGDLEATDYAGRLIWEFKGDWDNDIRNSEYNIQRDYYWVNPASAFYGQLVDETNVGDVDKWRYQWGTPFFKKGVSVVHRGIATDSQSGESHDQGRIFKDWYVMRLAETYLLRAEAYHKMGNNGNAAADINVVRQRAQATPVTAGEMDIDLILDERARELYQEEYRLNTLMRTGKLVEHLMNYNEVVINSGVVLGEHLNKLPIPTSEIEANKEKLLQQNPGY